MTGQGWHVRVGWEVYLCGVPTIMKGPVGVYVEALLWRRCLSEGVTDVGTVDKEIFGSGNGIKEARAGLLDTVCIGFAENLD